jgi:hypothetical protein
MKFIFLLLIVFNYSLFAQTLGKHSMQSKDLDSKVILKTDGVSPTLRIKPVYTKVLSDSLVETSGLIAFDHLLWTHNDDHDTTIYGLDEQGLIRRKIALPKVRNTDWEEITQDSTYIYIGDFGNNYKGNRRDLHILRIEKNSFLANKPVIDTIGFAYDNQIDFNPQKENTTDFDCEAFVVLQDSIYLFTKQWKLHQTAVYTLPKKPGNYKATYKETLTIAGLVTGATVLPSNKGIVFCGYSSLLQPFVFVLHHYKATEFSTGKLQKITLSLPFHQVEGIASFDGLHFYCTNERFEKKPFLTMKQEIHQLDLSDYLKYLDTN